MNGTTTVFVTDADNREVLEYDGSSGAIQRWYAYNLGPNDVLNQTNVVSSTRATLIPDIQGSIIASLDSGSGSLSKLGYLPYGKSASAGPFGFTGQRVDVEIGGLYYYHARHYSPAWGRFLQTDPSGYQGGIHLYAYVRNDPLNLIDPSGLSPDSPQVSGSIADVGSLPSDAGSLVAGVGFGAIASGAGSTDQPLQLAAADESMRPGNRPPLVEGGGGGGLGGGFGGSTSGGRSPFYSPPEEPYTPPASSFGGSLSNPLQAPSGPPRNPPGEFNGVPYTGHAFDQLQNRGIPPSVVDEAIQTGIPNPGNTPNTTRYYDPTNNLSIIRDNASGRVITVRPGN